MGPTAGLEALEKQKTCPCQQTVAVVVVVAAVVLIMTMMTRL